MWSAPMQVAQLAEVVLVERRHPHVALERLARVLRVQVRGLPVRLLQLLEEVEHPVGAGLDRGDAQVREALEEAVGEQVGERCPASRSRDTSERNGFWRNASISAALAPVGRGTCCSRLSPPWTTTRRAGLVDAAPRTGRTPGRTVTGRPTAVMTGPGHAARRSGRRGRAPTRSSRPRASGSTSVKYRRGEDPLLVGEAPVLVHPPVEGAERGHAAPAGRRAAPAPCRRRGSAGRSRPACPARPSARAARRGRGTPGRSAIGRARRTARGTSSLFGLRPRKYSSSAPGLETGSNVGFGMKRLILPPTSSRCLAVDLDPLHRPLAVLRLDVAGEGVERLVVVVVAVEVLEVHLRHGALPFLRSRF